MDVIRTALWAGSFAGLLALCLSGMGVEHAGPIAGSVTILFILQRQRQQPIN